MATASARHNLDVGPVSFAVLGLTLSFMSAVLLVASALSDAPPGVQVVYDEVPLTVALLVSRVVLLGAGLAVSIALLKTHRSVLRLTAWTLATIGLVWSFVALMM